MKNDCKHMLLLTLILLQNSGMVTTAGGHSACETTGTVFEGDPATVTCHFYRHHNKFMVYRLLSSSEQKEEIVTVCTFTESGLDCNDIDGHKVTPSNSSRQATVHIASAQQKNSGTYFCKTLPAWKDNASNCTLIVQSNTPRTLITCNANGPVSLGQKSWLDCKFSKNAGSTGITLVKTSGVGLTDEEDILACNGDGNCKVKTAGYEIDEKTETHVRVSIPKLQSHHTGNYECKSATLKGITHSCQLQTVLGHAKVEDSSSAWLYAGLGVLVSALAVILFCVVLYTVWRRKHKAPTNCESSEQMLSKAMA